MEEIKRDVQQNIQGRLFIDTEHANTEEQSTHPRKRRKMTAKEKMENIDSLLDEALNEAQCSFAHLDHKPIVEEKKEDLKPLKKSNESTVPSRYSGSGEPRSLCRKVDCELSKDHLRHSHPVDLTDPRFRVPFDCGWKREIVLRLDGKNSDVYYYPPVLDKTNVKQSQKLHNLNEKGGKNQAAKQNRTQGGDKCRSFIDVAKFLEKSCTNHQLTIENFTFAKQLLGCNDPSKEYVRHAVDVLVRKKIREKLKSESRKERSPKSPSSGMKMSAVGVASNESFGEISQSVKNESTQEFAGSTLKVKNIPATSNDESSMNNEASKDHPGKFPVEIKSLDVPTSSEQLISISQQNPLVTQDGHKSTTGMPQPRLSNSSKHLRPRIQQPLYDERLIMNKFRHRTVIKSPRRRRCPKDSKRQEKRIAASKMPITASIKKPNASTTTRLSNPIPENFQANSMPFDIESLGFPVSGTLFDAQKSLMQGSQLVSSSIVEQTTESQGQISSTLDLVNRNLSNHVEEIKIEPELYVLDRMVQPKSEMVQGRESIHINEACAADDYQFKVFMREENAPDDKNEIRRFSMKFDTTPIYTHLCEMLHTIFPNLKNRSFTLEWKDCEGDRIAVSSCVELKEALKVMRNYKVMKFYITVPSCNVLHDTNLTARNI